ncbi:lipid-A-disaccharide synthase [Fibrobacterales bacterium]|nr:lipid-A-disaccharide synthase [Fibrobacterales bacterium]
MNGQNPLQNDFILIVAGEDSGDIIGENAVRSAVRDGFSVFGTGGKKMQKAGLIPLANFEDLAVNGFLDVLKKLPKLLWVMRKIITELKKKECVKLVCIDYAGMNLRLLKIAKKIGKPVFYIAPPQIWAWKKSRGRFFKGVSVGVFFPFEEEIYKEFGASVVKLEHPALSNIKNAKPTFEFQNKTLFLTGSRLGQVKRNINTYIKMALVAQSKGETPLFVASRPVLAEFLIKKLKNKFPVIVKPAIASFKGAKSVVATPGTAIFEAYIAGVPTEAVAVIDPLTYIMGKLFLKTKYLTLPNILSGKEVVSERIIVKWI